MYPSRRAALRPGADASTLEAAIDADTRCPVRLTVYMRFRPGAAQQPFDLQFAAATSNRDLPVRPD